MKSIILFVVAVVSFGIFASPAKGEGAQPNVLYIAPQGDDAATGEREKPLRTVKVAIRRLAGSGGIIRLLGGVYNEEVKIAGAGTTDRLTVEAVEGESVVFDGGSDLSQWRSLEGGPGIYVSTAKEVVNVWDPASRFRYLKELDEPGVRGWPGAFCVREGSQVLIQTPDQKPPGTLRCNRLAVGFEITRNHTTIKGIEFRDYLGDKGATAINVVGASDVEVIDCTITNSVRGVAADKASRDLRVQNCRITDVACGVSFGGIGLEVTDCVMLAAVGDYAIREEADYDQLNGIRFYHPAEKGTLKGNITAGFWTGLYQKTSVGFDGAKPFVCEGNLFLDGVQSITNAQKGNLYRGNLIFGGALNLTRMEEKKATVVENYVFHIGKRSDRDHGAGNRLGWNPFVDLSGGDLQANAEAKLPPAAAESVAHFANRNVQWTPEIAAMLSARFSPKEAAAALRFVGEPICSSSARGAVVSVKLNAPAKGLLRYRAVGEKEWQSIAGNETLLSSAKALASMENVTDVEDEVGEIPYYSIVFPLLDGKLKPGKEYEYELSLKQGTVEALTSKPKRFRTVGEPKEIIAGKGRGGLQDAFDRVLPGDTVRMEAGVYAYPALLSHGGTADAPITICGTGDQTFLDGGRRFQALLELRGVRYVTVRDLQVRLFERAGIVAQDCEYLKFEKCVFMNKAIAHQGYTKGNGILLMNSPHTTVNQCIFTRLLYGVQANDSPELTLTQNTSFKNLFSSALLRNSSRNSRVTHNSFTFTGNISFYVIEKDPAAFKSLVSDYNNFAAKIRVIGETAARAYAGSGVALPEKMDSISEPAERYGPVPGSKRIFDYIGATGETSRERFFSMDAWREFSGKDANSVYADPQYVDPLRGDFRLMPGSPNIIGDIVIGAATVRE